MKHQVFVSSTFLDLKDERARIITTLLDLDVIPAGMEYFPAIDQEQFEFIKRVIDESDYYVIIIGGRYGSINSEGISYTELEYDYAISKNIPVIALVKENFENSNEYKLESDNSKKDSLKKFVYEKIYKGRIVRTWTNADNLAGTLAVSLSHTKKIFPKSGWVKSGEVSKNEILEENHKLRKEIEELNQKIANSRDKSYEYVDYFLRYIFTVTKPASRQDYKNWIDGYKKLGGEVKASGFKAPVDEIRVVDTSIYVPPLYGSKSLSFLVMPNGKLNILGKNIGHSTIYYMEDFRCEGTRSPADL